MSDATTAFVKMIKVVKVGTDIIELQNTFFERLSRPNLNQ